MTKNTRTTTRKTQPPPKSKAPWLWIAGGALGLALIVWMAASIASEPVVDESIGYGEVTVEGTDLPFIADPSGADPGLGLTAPTLTGADWEGNQVTIGPDGRPKIVVFLAHWCPHCQREVPVIQQWIDDGGLPEGVDMYAITALTDPLRPEWPPQDWLESEGWTQPTLMDSEDDEAVRAFGMQGTPFYVVLDGENVNLGRFSGEIGVAGLEALAGLAQSGAPAS